MLPPDWVVKALEEIDPHCRVGWIGETTCPEAQYRDLVWEWLLPEALTEQADEENVGQFYLLKLLHVKDAANTMHMAWGDAGPIYGSSYDPLARIPFITMPMTKRSMHNGMVIRILRDMVKPWRKVVIEGLKERDAEFKRDREDHDNEVGERVWHKAQRSDASGEIVAKKHISKKDLAIAAGDVPSSNLDTYHQDMVMGKNNG